MAARGNALVTGAAGFIGAHVARRLADAGWTVTGLDAMTDDYDVGLKRARLATLIPGVDVREGAVETPGLLDDLFAETRPDVVVHLAARAGVRRSIQNPEPYIASNVEGTFRLLEAARAHPTKHLLLASTSSAYGAVTEMPYRETMKADWPVSIYAATKKATEEIAHAYAHLFRLPVTMFRFFTVYGPWGRPDMAAFLFTKAMLEGRPIDVYNHGRMRRDFTFVDDLVAAIMALADAVPGDTPVGAADSLSPVAPFRVVNIGNASPVELGRFIEGLEAALGIAATRNLMDMQAGDVPATWADTSLLAALGAPVPATRIEDGLAAFVAWYRDHYGV